MTSLQHHVALQRLHGEKLAAILVGQSVRLVDDERVAEALRLVVLHRLEVAEGVGIGERAVLLEALAIIAALDVVEAARIAAVVAGEDAALLVDLDAEGVAAPFGEDLEALLLGMIAPDVLADHVDGAAPCRRAG